MSDVIVTLMASSKAFTLHSYGATLDYLAIGWVTPPMPPRPIITKGTAKASFNVATVNTKWGL